MSMIENLVYIVGGLALTHSFYGISKLLKALARSHPVNRVHLYFSLIAPFVIWQHIFQFLQHLGDNQNEKLNLFFISLVTIYNLSLLVAMSFILHPSLTECHMHNARFRQYLLEHRRVFYFVVLLYMGGIILSNRLLGIENDIWIILARAVIIVMAGIGFLISVEVEGQNVERFMLCIRVPYPVTENNNHGLDLNKKIIRINLCYIRNTIMEWKELRSKLYYHLDYWICILIIIAFVVITMLRNW